jgi:hypothetical protein
MLDAVFITGKEETMSEEATGKLFDPQPAEPDPRLVALGLQRLRTEQNFVAAIGAGLAAAAVGAVLWAVITVVTGYQIGFMAIGVGLLVGYAVRAAGKGMDKQFGVVGAAWAVLGCIAGNLLSVCYFVAAAQKLRLVDVLAQLTPERAFTMLGITFSVIDLLFYGIAVYEGYRLSFREVSPNQVLRVAHGAPSAT